MAIQMRRGQLANYDKSKMLPGEWGISIDNDSDNQKAFISFAPGVSKEVMMVEDAEEQIAVATAEAIDMATEEAEAWAHGNSFHVNDYASGDGSTKSFTLAETPSSIIGVYVDGSSVSAYTLSGKTITFTTAPASGSNNIRVYYTVNTTTDNSKYYKEQAEAVAESIPEDYTELSEDVDQLKNALGALGSSVFYDTTIKRGINLFNKNDARNKDDCYRNNNGVLVQATGTRFFITHPIAVKAGVEYKAIRQNNSYGENLKVFIVDASGENVLGSFDATAWISPIERDQFITFTPPETCFIQLSLGSEASPYKGYQKDFCVVCESANLPDEPIYQNYVPYQTDIISIDNKDHKQTISDVNYIKSCNLIDKRSPDVLTNCYISIAITSESNYYISAPIKVKKGVKYLLTHAAGMGSVRKYIYLNENLEPFTEPSSLIQDHTYSSMDSFTARLSGYVRVNLGTNPDAIVMCEYDNYNGYYAEYGFTLPDMKYPQLYGKIVSFNGDSICQGVGYAGGYGKIIAERNAMIYENIGVGGGTITAETYYKNGNPRHWICRTIDDMRSDADYIILEGGVNDSVASIGTVPDVNDYASALDDTKYAQAFESMLKQALNRFKGKKIGYIAVHKCTPSFTSNGNDSMNRYTIAINACKKWGIPVCDLNIECPPLGYVDSLKTEFTSNGDGWHPNEAGYKAYYVPKIEAWMASL